MSSVLKFKDDEKFYYERTQRNHYLLGGKDVQKKLKASKIGVAGLGGMGSNIAEYLARVGVGELRLADHDTIDISNINRQVIANTNTVGKKKAEASFNELSAIAPDTKIHTFTDGITSENVEEFVKGCDFVVDEIDVFPLEAHYLLHAACRKYNIPVYSAYVVGMGIHFYKFHGDEFKFEDFLSWNKEMSDKDVFDEVVKQVVQPEPKYLQGENLLEFKKMALNKGVPIFGPSCLLGHSTVVTRILCDFLGSKVLNTEVAKTPVMPNFLKIDLSTLEIKTETFIKK